ncbi:MAG: hypothetical protein K2Q10_11875, partial [Rhodospirillales bacterium]|nr:hypothetical protein [Rhodospirillales bacterium]
MSHQPLVAKQPGEAGKGVRIPRSPSVGIGFKIIICLAVVGVLPLFMVQVYTSKITTSALIQSHIEPLGTQTRRLAQRIQNFIDTARADVGFLGRLPLAAGVAGMDAEQVRRFDPQVMAPLTRLQGLFWEFGVAKPYYARLRYLDEHGREVTRVEFGNGMAQAAAPGLLEDLSEDACVRRAAELKPGQVTVCRFSNDKVSWRTDPPNEPMIRVFTAVFAEDGTRRGLVEGSVAGHFVLDELAEAERANEREIYLADSGGQSH